MDSASLHTHTRESFLAVHLGSTTVEWYELTSWCANGISKEFLKMEFYQVAVHRETYNIAIEWVIHAVMLPIQENRLLGKYHKKNILFPLLLAKMIAYPRLIRWTITNSSSGIYIECSTPV